MTTLRTVSTHSSINIDYANGVVGPLQETFTDGTSRIYFGGAQQYEFIDNLKKGNWENFLIIKNKQGVILK